MGSLTSSIAPARSVPLVSQALTLARFLDPDYLLQRRDDDCTSGKCRHPPKGSLDIVPMRRSLFPARHLRLLSDGLLDLLAFLFS